MKKHSFAKIILLFLILLLSIGSVSAVYDDTNLSSYWPLDSSSIDYYGSLTGTDTTMNYQSTINIDNGSAYFNSALGGTSAGGFIDLGASSNWNLGSNHYTIQGWIYKNSSATNPSHGIFVSGDAYFEANLKIGLYYAAANDVLTYERRGTGSNSITTVTTDDTWTFISMVYDGADIILYKDGVEVNRTASAGAIPAHAGGSNACFGAMECDGTNNGFLGGYLDEWAFYNNRALTSTEISTAYNSGNYLRPFGGVTSSNLTITVLDEWDSSAVNNVSALIDGTTYTNNTGNLIYTDIPLNNSVLEDITISSNNYFTRNYLNYNLSSSLSASISQNFVVFEAEEIFTSNKLPYVMVTPTDLNASARVREYYFQTNSSTLATIIRIPTIGLPLTYNITIPASCFATNGFLNLTFIDDLNDEYYATCNNFYGEQQVVYNATGEDINGIDSNGEFFFQNINTTINSQQQVMFPLRTGFYNVSFNAQDYFTATNTLNISVLNNYTALLEEIGSSIITVRVKDAYNNTNLSSFSGTITNNELEVTTVFSTSGQEVDVLVLAGYNYTLNLNPVSGYSTNTGLQLNLSINTTYTNATFNIYQNNSILFSFYNSDLTPFLSNVNITLQNNNITYTFNTSSGELFASELNAGTYTLSAVTSNFSVVQQIITLNNGEFITANVYFNSDLLPKIFNVIDNIGNPVSEATLTFFYFVNGSLITQTSALTDFSGQTILLLNEDTTYSFLVTKEGYNTFSGNVKPTNNEYTINIELTGATIFTSLFADLSYRINISDLGNLSFILANYEIASSQASLQYFGFSTTYNNINYLINNTGNPSGGSLQFNITGINTSTEPTITITYWFKSVNYEYTEFEITYFINNAVEQSTNFATIKTTTQNLSPQIKVLLGFFLMLIMIIIGVSLGDNVGGQIMGVIATGINMYLGLFPVLAGSVVIIVIVIFIISSEVNK